jgi:hypothetical protein
VIDCTLGTDSCLQMFNGGKYVKWEVLQDIAMFGINSVQVPFWLFLLIVALCLCRQF